MTKPQKKNFSLCVQTFFVMLLYSSYPFLRFPIVVLPKLCGSSPERNKQHFFKENIYVSRSGNEEIQEHEQKKIRIQAK